MYGATKLDAGAGASISNSARRGPARLCAPNSVSVYTRDARICGIGYILYSLFERVRGAVSRWVRRGRVG